MLISHPIVPGELTFESETARRSADETRAYKRVNNADLLISLHLPPEYAPEKEKYPLFVFIHGGGWASRRIFEEQADWSGDYLGFLARYYADKGFLCAGIDYRLLKEGGQAAGHEMIDLIGDCMDAADYLSCHAGELGADLTRTAVLGESAGGHLAGMLAVRTSFFKTAILVNPITDLRDEKWNHLLPVAPAHPLLQGREAEELCRICSPIDHIHPNMCSALLLHGAADSVVNPAHSRAFHDRMLEAGVRSELHLIEDTNHAFLLADYMHECGRTLDAANIAVMRIDEWLKTAL